MASPWRSKTSIKLGIKSPLGPLTIKASGGAITGLTWEPGPDCDDALLNDAARQLAAYFDGRLTEFDLPLNHGAKGLGARVLAAMLEIPFGDTRTYGDLAREIGGSAQAVGQACGANTIPIIIPCHRILAANSLGGFSGGVGVDTKVALLRLEGAAGLLI